MSVRIGRVEDLGEILAIEQEAEEGPHWAEERYREALVPREVGAAVRRRVVIWEGLEGIAGFAVGMVLEVGGESDGEIEHVVVKKEARRMGAGRELCGALLVWAREQGTERVMLEVRASNIGAISLYAGLGFREVGRRKGYYAGPVEDAVLMEL